MERRIVFAANKVKATNQIILGARHFDIWMRNTIVFDKDQNKFIAGNKVKNGDVIQGFIDNKENFLEREEAYKVAKAAGQIIEKTGPEGNVILFSEDLY